MPIATNDEIQTVYCSNGWMEIRDRTNEEAWIAIKDAVEAES